jgi:hypothetical protein
MEISYTWLDGIRLPILLIPSTDLTDDTDDTDDD